VADACDDRILSPRLRITVDSRSDADPEFSAEADALARAFAPADAETWPA